MSYSAISWIVPAQPPSFVLLAGGALAPVREPSLMLDLIALHRGCPASHRRPAVLCCLGVFVDFRIANAVLYFA